MSDGHLAVLFKWIEEGYNPSHHELFIRSPSVKDFWLHKKKHKQYNIKNSKFIPASFNIGRRNLIQ